MSGKTDTGDGQERKSLRFLSAAEMFKLQAEPSGQCVIDVRGRDEYSRYHLEGAQLRPLGEISSWSKELDKDRTTVVYCQRGVRCVKAAQVLQDMGFHDIVVLDGGVDAYLEYIRSKERN